MSTAAFDPVMWAPVSETEQIIVAAAQQALQAREPAAVEQARATTAPGPQDRERLAALNAAAGRFYAAQLPGSWAGEYLTERLGKGFVTDEAARPGYAPASWTATLDHLRGQGFTDSELLESGVAFRSQKTGRLCAQQRDRAVFGVHDQTGAIAGFVGRARPGSPEEQTAKYLNPRNTGLFDRSQLVFSPAPLRPGKQAVIVEGPMDAAAVTVASGGRLVGASTLGWSMTPGQASALWQTGVPPLLARDGDAAGMLKGLDQDVRTLATLGVESRAALLPAGTDPASVLQDQGRAALLTVLAQHHPAHVVVAREHVRAGNAPAALEAVAAQHPSHWNSGLAAIAETSALEPAAVREQFANMLGRQLSAAWAREDRTATSEGDAGVAASPGRPALLDQVRDASEQRAAGAQSGTPRIPGRAHADIRGEGIER